MLSSSPTGNLLSQPCLVVCEFWQPEPGCNGGDGTTIIEFYKFGPELDPDTIPQIFEVIKKDDQDEFMKHYCIKPGQSLWTQGFGNACLSCCSGYSKTNFFFDIKDARPVGQHGDDEYFESREHTYTVMLEQAVDIYSTAPIEEPAEVGRPLTDQEIQMINALGREILKASAEHRFSDIPLIQKKIAEIQKVMFE
jgi:hypothetical protein